MSEINLFFDRLRGLTKMEARQKQSLDKIGGWCDT